MPATSLWLDPILLAEVRHRAAKRECEARMRRLRMEIIKVEDEEVQMFKVEDEDLTKTNLSIERWRDISIGNSLPSCTASITLRSKGSRIYKNH